MITSIMKEQVVDASREWIWNKLTDVRSWSEWDLEVKHSQLYTSFNKGSKGYLIDQDNIRSEFEITDIEEKHSYSNVYCISTDLSLNFKHSIIGNDCPYLVRFEAFFSGDTAEDYFVNHNTLVSLTMTNALNNLSVLAKSSLCI